MATVEGKTVKVGDVVYFKCDIEQCGEIVKIRRNLLGQHEFDLKSLYDGGFDGGYIGGDEYTTVEARDCWLEG